MRFRAVLALGGFVAALVIGMSASADERLTFDGTEMAGISGLRPFWNRPVVLSENGLKERSGRGKSLEAERAVWAPDLQWHSGLNYWVENKSFKGDRHAPGAICFDAVHRSLLVRFPGAAQGIADKLNAGFDVAKVELLLPYKGAEKMARGYKEPASFIQNMWDREEPRWHAVVWALRRPWKADVEKGPTFNAYINGSGYWAKYGAQNQLSDRFPQQFGPSEVSVKVSEPVDVTAVVRDAAFGPSLADRLLVLDQQGFIVSKWELYDFRFANPGYEWATMTGGRGIFVAMPKLVVTFTPSRKAAEKIVVAPAPWEKVLVRAMASSQGPTAVLPSPELFAQLKAEYRFKRPAWMPDWQWTRVSELYALDGRANTFPETEEAYCHWIDELLATQPRKWEGFNASDQLVLLYQFKDAIPAPVVDHWRQYWTAWLMPYLETRDMVHNQYHQIYTPWRGFGSDYYDRTGDWRGNSSFYRESYTRIISTMNFNHTAALGALLGGRFIGSERAMADGRFGLEHFPLRLWAWFDGTTQESIDHYYLAITLTDQKMFADFGPTQYDRMMGDSILLKSMEELAGCYHPGLRRFISTSTRTSPEYVIQTQDGCQHIADSMSPSGALTDLDKVAANEAAARKGQELDKVNVIGHDLSPRRVAMQAVTSPWAPEWMSNIFDRKPLPYEMTMTFRQWGAHIEHPKWKKSFLAGSYGLASYDFGDATINLMALWRTVDEQVATADQLGLLLVRYGWNRTNLLDGHMGGTLGRMGGIPAALQHRNKMIVIGSPTWNLSSSHYDPSKQPILSLQTTAGILTTRPAPQWTLHVDGQPVGALPFAVKTGQHIALQDGVSFIGLVPLPSSDLGRDAEAEIHAGGPPVRVQSGGIMTETLVVDAFNYRSKTPLDLAKTDPTVLDCAYGGFIVELGDTAEFADLAAFERHLADAKLETRWEPDNKTLHVKYSSGGDVMEAGYCTYMGPDWNDRTPMTALWKYRRVNGAWPYLPEGVDRESPLSIQGRKGTLDKGGATLRVEPGRMGYLLTEPVSGTFLAANPLPDATEFVMHMPGRWSVEADGKLGIARVVVRPGQNRLWVDYAVRDDQQGPEMATALLVFGADGKLTATLNGRDATAVQTVLGDRRAAVIPLAGAAAPDAARRYEKRLAARDEALSAARPAEAAMRYEAGQEHYLLTVPRPGAWEFQRLWPGGTVLDARIPGGLRVVSDGRVALRNLVLDGETGRVDVDAPLYMQEATGPLKFEGRARALLIFGAKERPTVFVNERAWDGDMPAVEIDGAKAWVVPLWGAKAADVLPGIAERVKEALAKLPKP